MDKRFDTSAEGTADTPLRCLYIASLAPGSTSLHRMQAMADLGHAVTGIDTATRDVASPQRRPLWRRVRYKLLGPWDETGANRSVTEHVNSAPFDVIWMDKCLTLCPETLRAARRLQPNCKLVGYSPDDMFARHNQSRQFLDHLPMYDIYFTTKSYGVAELKSMGARRVEFVGNAYHRDAHRPIDVTDEDRRQLGGPVGFVGDYEEERARAMHHLAANGVPVRIWGPNWHKCRVTHPNLRIEGRPLWADDYIKAVCSFDINLCFLRKINRDLQTTRSVEIPACRAFMLAERTEEHLGLFREGAEAAFFSSDQELLAKARYYMEHATERGAIAAAGYLRCQTSGYSNHDRMAWMLGRVREL